MTSLALDMPDDYPWLPGSNKFPLADLGELAARLGSPVTYDRRGLVLFMDDFENGLSPWLAGSSGTGGSVTISAERSYSGGYSCKLVGGSDGDLTAQLHKYIQPLSPTTIGTEWMFSLPSTIGYINIVIQLADGATRNLWDIKIAPSVNKVYYLGADNLYHEFMTAGNMMANAYLFHTVKLVVGMIAHSYARLMLDQVEHDFAGEGCYSVASALKPHIYASFRLYSRAGNNDIAYVDNSIITTDEA